LYVVTVIASAIFASWHVNTNTILFSASDRRPPLMPSPIIMEFTAKVTAVSPNLAQMFLSGTTLGEKLLTALGTRPSIPTMVMLIIVPHSEVTMQTKGTRRIVHAVLVAAVSVVPVRQQPARAVSKAGSGFTKG
jgi:hypothetical protein